MTSPALPAAASIWDRERVWVTVGIVALIFLTAVQALAVTTVMPVVSRDLDGDALYALAFSGTLATSVIGMVLTGAWCDRTGPRIPLFVAVTLFGLGMLIAGLAPDMVIFVLGRLVLGVGSGGIIVALYVVVARAYPPGLHGRIFAAFAAAWVVPSMVGPFLAGLVAQFLHWRWVFLGVVILTALAFALVTIRLRRVDLGHGAASGRFGIRLLLAVVVAIASVVLGAAAEMSPAQSVVVAVICVVVTVFAIIPLLPRGTLRSGTGLPSAVLLRGMLAAGFFSAEVYIPYQMIEHFGWEPSVAGLALTVAGVMWAAGAEVQGRYGDRLGNTRLVVMSLTIMVASMLAVFLTSLLGLHPAVLIVGWGFVGGAMGIAYPRTTILGLAYSTPQTQGFNSAALSISDAVGAATVIALMGLVVTAMGRGPLAFPVVFGISLAILALALIPGSRLGRARDLRIGHAD